jgi:AAA+ superfamily predicted ATPase
MPPHLAADGVAAHVRAQPDMTLVVDRVLGLDDIAAELALVPRDVPCALLLVAPAADVDARIQRWRAERPGLAVGWIDVVDYTLHLSLRDPGLDHRALLDAVRVLVRRSGEGDLARTEHFRLHAVTGSTEEAARAPSAPVSGTDLSERPLLTAALQWIHVLLRNAIPEAGTQGSSEVPGVTLTAAALAGAMDARAPQAKPTMPPDVVEADASLTRALMAADIRTEPLAVAFRAFRLTPLEFRILVLALAPELDVRYQRCMSWLVDDFGRRVGTVALFAALLGEPSMIRRQLAHSSNLVRWRAIDGTLGITRAGDEPLRVDPPIAGWLLGERSALDHDARVRRLMHLLPWPGSALLSDRDRVNAEALVEKLQSRELPQWLIFAGDDTSGWRALLELGADGRRTIPIRIDAARLAGLDTAEIEESGVRLGRLRRMTGRPLVVDAWYSDQTQQDDDALRLLLAAIGGTGGRAAVVCSDPARIIRLLGATHCTVHDRPPLDATARADAFQVAARALEIDLGDDDAKALAERYPLPIESLEEAVQLARGQRLSNDDEARSRERFTAACREVAAEGVSRLANRIDPSYRLDDLVLPADRVRQLREIVTSVHLAPKVLDDWHFRDQLPYGRGVSVLFHGASGTGKTMAAHGIAHALDVQLLRVDLSKVVSKYIGDTEKNIDRVFLDAQRSGAAILIDEADALLGKRSEVKDAHDRYANIEVAYLLQRMEAFEGLAILTTNMRHNLDPAFLRRLRFIVDFPRPDVEAREQIWRRCLPPESHALDDAAFRLIARKIDLTGGHIRQITVRAAFVAAAEDSRIGLGHVAYASRAEFAKLGVPAVELEAPAQRRAA